MDITDIRVYPVKDDKVRAFVSIVFDRCFMVNDIKVIQGKEGLFVSMPSRKRKNGEFKDVAHPLNTETRRWVEDRILGEYQAALEGRPSPAAVAAPAEEGDASAAEPSLEEIERHHLGDSFWGVT